MHGGRNVGEEDEWERVLWKKKSYPDNFVPPKSFLSSLSKNPNFKPYTYFSLVLSSCIINQHLAALFVFLAIFVRLNQGTLDPRILVYISIGGFMLGYAFWELLQFCSYTNAASVTQTTRAKTLKSSILVFLALLSLSPVLRTLTAATSSDSIWALSACLFILHVLLADYSAVSTEMHHRERLTSVLSMNAAVSSAVVLASRLPDEVSVFALMLASVQVFALFPFLLRRLQSGPTIMQICITFMLCASAIMMVQSLSIMATRLIAGIMVLVSFLAPGVLVWAQKYKNEIRGTWDPAVPKVYSAKPFI